MKTLKGFTIIELLVVIAIIAVLAAIVLVNVTSYINKGRDAAIKGNLATLMINGAVVIDAGTALTSFCSTTVNPGLTYYKPVKLAVEAITSGTMTCYVNTAADGWCACSALKTSGKYFCVDSTGTKIEGTTACNSGTMCVTGATTTCK